MHPDHQPGWLRRVAYLPARWQGQECEVTLNLSIVVILLDSLSWSLTIYIGEGMWENISSSDETSFPIMRIITYKNALLHGGMHVSEYHYCLDWLDFRAGYLFWVHCTFALYRTPGTHGAHRTRHQ